MPTIRQAAHPLLFLALMSLPASLHAAPPEAQATPQPPEPLPVFQESFDGYADGEFPTSLIEVKRRRFDFSEVQNRWLAVNMHGNPLLLMAPAVKNFDLSWDAKAGPGSERLPVEVYFRASADLLKSVRLAADVRQDSAEVTLSRPGTAILREPGLKVPPAAPDQPRRFRLEVRDQRVGLFIDGSEVFRSESGLPTTAGFIALGAQEGAGWDKKTVMPVFFKNIRVDWKDAEPAQVERVGQWEFAVEGLEEWAPAVLKWNENLRHRVTVEKVKNTPAAECFSDVKDGGVYRVTGELTAPLHRMAIEDPYVRLDAPDGATVYQGRIFSGIVGTVAPTSHSTATHYLRASRENPPPHYGVEKRMVGAGEANGPLAQSGYVRSLPPGFLIAGGGRRFAFDRGLSQDQSREKLIGQDGKALRSGRDVSAGRVALELAHEASPGLLARYKQFLGAGESDFGPHYLSRNLHFLEGESPVLRFQAAAKPETGLSRAVEWRLLDACFTPIGEPRLSSWPETRAPARAAADGLLHAATLPLQLPPLAAGVYHLEYRLAGDPAWQWRAFSIVPKEAKTGNTAAAASGFPVIFSDFDDGADYNHYLTQSGTRTSDPGQVALRRALNHKVFWISAGHMAADADAKGTAEVLRQFDGIMHPHQVAPGEPNWGFPHPPARPNRYWLSNGFTPPNLEAYAASKFFPAGADPKKIDPRSPEHYAAWTAYWCSRVEEALREMVAHYDAVKPGMDLITYGPTMAVNWVYNSPYHARFNGYDLEKLQGKPNDTSLIVETYASGFRRGFESYVPTLALSHLVAGGKPPRLFWEMYGSHAGSAGSDERDMNGSAPHGFSFSSPSGMAAQYAELMYGPWYFNGKSVVSGSDHSFFPGFVTFTRDQLRGLVEGLKLPPTDALARPVKGPAFVYSRGAADADRTWKMGQRMVGNFAAEAPAFSFVQTRKAGLPGGFFMKDSDLGALDPKAITCLVIPGTRGLAPGALAEIRRLHAAGVPLVAYDDVSGLEDIFGVRRLDKPVAIESIQRRDGDTVLAGLPEDVAARKIPHKGDVCYALDGASEILVGTGGTGTAPVLTLNRKEGRAPAVFFAFGATEVARESQYVEFGNQEGGSTSPLIEQAFRAVFRNISEPSVSVTPPASVLAFERKDGGQEILVYESAWPNDPKPCTVRLTLRSPDVGKIDTPKPCRVVRDGPDLKELDFDLTPNEVVLIHTKPE